MVIMAFQAEVSEPFGRVPLQPFQQVTGFEWVLLWALLMGGYLILAAAVLWVAMLTGS